MKEGSLHLHRTNYKRKLTGQINSQFTRIFKFQTSSNYQSHKQHNRADPAFSFACFFPTMHIYIASNATFLFQLKHFLDKTTLLPSPLETSVAHSDIEYSSRRKVEGELLRKGEYARSQNF